MSISTLRMEVQKQALRDAFPNLPVYAEFSWRCNHLRGDDPLPQGLVPLPEPQQNKGVEHVGVAYIYHPKSDLRYTLPEFLNEHQ